MLEAYFYELWWLLGALFFGVFLGSLTGLIPGFHVNNVALILLALSPGLLELGIPLSAVACNHCFNRNRSHFLELYSIRIDWRTRW